MVSKPGRKIRASHLPIVNDDVIPTVLLPTPTADSSPLLVGEDANNHYVSSTVSGFDFSPFLLPGGGISVGTLDQGSTSESELNPNGGSVGTVVQPSISLDLDSGGLAHRRPAGDGVATHVLGAAIVPRGDGLSGDHGGRRSTAEDDVARVLVSATAPHIAPHGDGLGGDRGGRRSAVEDDVALVLVGATPGGYIDVAGATTVGAGHGTGVPNTLPMEDDRRQRLVAAGRRAKLMWFIRFVVDGVLLTCMENSVDLTNNAKSPNVFAAYVIGFVVWTIVVMKREDLLEEPVLSPSHRLEWGAAVLKMIYLGCLRALNRYGISSTKHVVIYTVIRCCCSVIIKFVSALVTFKSLNNKLERAIADLGTAAASHQD